MFASIFILKICYAGDLGDSVSRYKSKLFSFGKTLFGNEMEEDSEIKLPSIPTLNNDTKKVTIPSTNNNAKKISENEKKHLDYLFIEELFETVLNRKVRNSDFKKWLNVLSQGGSREGVYRALVLGREYANLELGDYPIKPRVVKFSDQVMQKFLNRSIDENISNKINFFTLKRLIIERALEMIDELAKNRSDLYDWYAILSSDLAIQHFKTWKIKLRKDPKTTNHRVWASSASEQNLKSEVIIKLHKALNGLY